MTFRSARGDTQVFLCLVGRCNQYEVDQRATCALPAPPMCVEEYAQLSLEPGVGAHRPHSGVCPAYPSGVSRGERKKVF